MFVVLLKFAENKSSVGDLMEAHNKWLQRGFDDSIFLLAGSVKPNQGGAIIANNISHDELQKRVSEDPFVAEKVVTSEIIEIAPGITDERLAFLL